MICLFDRFETDFSGNGICILSPSVCTVSEIAGGSYSLHMEHPMDDAEKYALLTDEMVIRAPVPPVHIPKITLPTVYVYKTGNEPANLYSALPTYRREPCAADIKKVKQNPNAYAWGGSIEYKKNNLVTDSGGIYRAKSDNFAQPPTNTTFWKYETTVSGSGDTIEQLGGKIAVEVPANTYVYKVADYNETYMQARTVVSNKTYSGYIEIDKCVYQETTESGQVIDAQDITEQLFRIVRVYGEDDKQTISVDAMHISYDFKGNSMYACNVANSDPMTAISLLRGTLLDEDNRVIACDITGKTVTKDWSFLNPIQALLDPDDGLVPLLGARLVRNNQDFYILSNASPRNGIRIAYGHNMTGVSWNRSTENVFTRVLPRCGDGNKNNPGYVFIDNVYMESDISSEYAFQRTEMLDCGFNVGDKYKKPGDVTETTITEQMAKTMMEEQALKRFTVDHCDAVEVELDVSFVLLGDTEEYRQYRGLQTVCLYDEITVEMPKSRLTATAQVSEYEYDAILKRYNSIKVGDIKAMQRRIPGYRLKAGSITYEKLGSSLISKIKSASAVEEST